MRFLLCTAVIVTAFIGAHADLKVPQEPTSVNSAVSPTDAEKLAKLSLIETQIDVNLNKNGTLIPVPSFISLNTSYGTGIGAGGSLIVPLAFPLGLLFPNFPPLNLTLGFNANKNVALAVNAGAGEGVGEGSDNSGWGPTPAPGWAAPSSTPGWEAPSSTPGWAPPSSTPGWEAPSSTPGWAAPSLPPGWAAPSLPPGWAAPPSSPGWAVPPTTPGWSAPSSTPGWGPGWKKSEDKAHAEK